MNLHRRGAIQETGPKRCESWLGCSVVFLLAEYISAASESTSSGNALLSKQPEDPGCALLLLCLDAAERRSKHNFVHVHVQACCKLVCARLLTWTSFLPSSSSSSSSSSSISSSFNHSHFLNAILTLSCRLSVINLGCLLHATDTGNRSLHVANTSNRRDTKRYVQVQAQMSNKRQNGAE